MTSCDLIDGSPTGLLFQLFQLSRFDIRFLHFTVLGKIGNIQVEDLREDIRICVDRLDKPSFDLHGQLYLEIVLLNAPGLNVGIIAHQGLAVMAVRFVLLRLARLVKSPCLNGILIIMPHRILCGDPETEVTSVSTDSRKIAPGALFVPIHGERTDAHAYIPATFAAGAAGLAPTWYVTGNHEFSVEEGTRQTLFQGLAQAGVHLLDDNWAQLELPGGAPLLLAGVSDTALRAGDVQNVLAAARAESGLEEALTLLLAHEPQYLQSYAAAGADLVFCGHAHGGQIRLPAVGGLFAPGQGPLPEYTAGLYQAEETTMLVSRGLGNSVFPLRVFNRPEITALTLRAEGA